jgi:4-amino-4-deoxy-L-arabinose transferase-like glycosyltransferase
MTSRADLTLGSADLAAPAADGGHPSGGRSFPRTRLAELMVFALALGTNLWSLSIQGYGNHYYAAAVRSMTESWTNFFFASFDPGGWSTVDKPPLAWWVPALSARVFGYSSWSILWPAAVAGAIAVLLLVITVRRVWGPLAGLVAGCALATTPVAVAVSRSNNPDVWLILGVVAAAWATERAVATGKLRWAAWMGVLIGAAFLAKLGAALVVVPALWSAYLLASPTAWRRRAAGIAVATGSFVAVALAWVGTTAVVPQSSRPWIGGSTDGTAWDLVVGYNGLGRITGAGADSGGGSGPGQLPGSVVDSFGGDPGIGRLFNAGMGDQVMWLFIVAAIAGVAATWLLLRRRLVGREAGSLIAWGGWAAATFVAFSFAGGTFHNYYVSLLAPAIAALVGIGAALLRQSRRPGALIAVGALAATAALQLVFLRRVDELTALRVLAPLLILVAASTLAVHAIRRPSRRTGGVLVVAAVASALVAPAAWSLSSLGHAATGSFPEARPVSLELDVASLSGGGAGASAGASGTPFAGAGSITAAELAWLRTRRTTERWLVAVDGSASLVEDAIIAGYSAMSIGGFRGVDPTMDNARLAELVRTGRLRFISIASTSTDTTGGSAPQGPGQPSDQQQPSESGPPPAMPGLESNGSVISATVASTCKKVSSKAWGDTRPSTLYDCAGMAQAIAAAASARTRQLP